MQFIFKSTKRQFSISANPSSWEEFKILRDKFWIICFNYRYRRTDYDNETSLFTAQFEDWVLDEIISDATAELT